MTVLVSDSPQTQGTSSVNSTTFVTAAFTPPDFSTLLMASGHRGAATQDSITDGFGGLTWTPLFTDDAGTRHIYLWISSRVGASPGSGTLTCTFSANTRHKLWIVGTATGVDSADPVVASAGNSGTASTLAITLAVAAGNAMISAVIDEGLATITAGADETEIAQQALDGPQDSTIQLQHAVAEEDDPDWADLAAINNAGIAAVLRAADDMPKFMDPRGIHRRLLVQSY